MARADLAISPITPSTDPRNLTLTRTQDSTEYITPRTLLTDLPKQRTSLTMAVRAQFENSSDIGVFSKLTNSSVVEVESQREPCTYAILTRLACFYDDLQLLFDRLGIILQLLLGL